MGSKKGQSSDGDQEVRALQHIVEELRQTPRWNGRIAVQGLRPRLVVHEVRLGPFEELVARHPCGPSAAPFVRISGVADIAHRCG